MPFFLKRHNLNSRSVNQMLRLEKLTKQYKTGDQALKGC